MASLASRRSLLNLAHANYFNFIWANHTSGTPGSTPEVWYKLYSIVATPSPRALRDCNMPKVPTKSKKPIATRQLTLTGAVIGESSSEVDNISAEQTIEQSLLDNLEQETMEKTWFTALEGEFSKSYFTSVRVLNFPLMPSKTESELRPVEALSADRTCIIHNLPSTLVSPNIFF